MLQKKLAMQQYPSQQTFMGAGASAGQGGYANTQATTMAQSKPIGATGGPLPTNLNGFQVSQPGPIGAGLLPP